VKYRCENNHDFGEPAIISKKTGLVVPPDNLKGKNPSGFPNEHYYETACPECRTTEYELLLKWRNRNLKMLVEKDGAIKINRAGRLKTMACPHAATPCGDWCPLFSEPETVTPVIENPEILRKLVSGPDMLEFVHGQASISLCICKKELICEVEEFEDLR